MSTKANKDHVKTLQHFLLPRDFPLLRRMQAAMPLLKSHAEPSKERQRDGKREKDCEKEGKNER